MLYRFLADFIVVFHFIFIIFALLGGLLGLWKKWYLLIHLPAGCWIAVVEFQGWICPLTPLENHFRVLSKTSGYEGGFVEHYLIPIIYPPGLTHQIQYVLGTIAVAINLGIYLFVFSRWKAKK